MPLAETVLSEIESRRAGDESCRWLLHPDAVFRFEGGSAVSILYVGWRRARNGAPIPVLGDYDSGSALTSPEARNAGVISIGESGQLRMTRPGARELGWDAAFENEHERSCMEYDIYSALFAREACYYHIDQLIDGVRARFSRILLPVSDARGEVVELVTCENHEIEPIVVASQR